MNIILEREVMRLLQYAHNTEYPDCKTMILDALGIDDNKIPRVRAVYIGDNGPIIHTRTGGGNREQYDTIENFIEGEYGLNSTIQEYKKILKSYEGWQWHIPIEYDIDPNDQYKPESRIPYEASYRYPETEEEWTTKEVEIKKTIQDLEAQKEDVLKTGAFTNEYLRNSHYAKDEDDEFDSTYATFFYTWPQGLKDKLIEAGYLSGEENNAPKGA